MTNDKLRKAICSGIKIVNRRTLKLMYVVLSESLAPNDVADEEELYQELEKRRKAYEAGQFKPLLASEAIARYRKRNKKR